MIYLRAYLRAFWDLFRVASVVYGLAYLFFGVSWVVAAYLGYLVAVASVAGPIKVLISK